MKSGGRDETPSRNALTLDREGGDENGGALERRGATDACCAVGCVPDMPDA